MAVEAINAFKTSDGRLHGNEKAALEHELWLEIHSCFKDACGHDYRLDHNGIEKIIRCRKELAAILTSEQSVALYKFDTGLTESTQ